ncbi:MULTISPECIES: AAA family ATPase [Streptomyces]|uniref:ATP-binding protein n=1 Tax=Streptomyces xinghaiensis TaxID=1038928 RepID=A0A3R7J019_9ACTN|nr:MULTISPECIES: AAA family ATPase [Streptomyces]PQM20981.1 ATPase [Streptomyces xinghaiensis]RKM92835.1 ATP-binding protein [Streptomyces xinghaiensis]RNC72423.1 ATP-binding protein [Streptomyces xinghaiensis]
MFIVTAATAPSRGLTLALVGGFAGSGKSEAGKLLAASTGWAMLDKDTLTRPLAEQLLVSLDGDPDDRHSRLYGEQVRPLEYACLMKAAWENLECGVSVILVAPFIKEVGEARWMSRLERRCRRLGGRVETVWVDSDVETMRERLISRNASRDTWKLTNWSEYVAGIDLSLRPVADHHLIDNCRAAARPLAEQVESAADRLLVTA